MSEHMTSPPEKQPPREWWLENASRIAAFRLRQQRYISANTIPIREQVRDCVEFVRQVWEEIDVAWRMSHDEVQPRQPAQ